MGYETMYQVSMILAPFEAATHPFHPAEISSHCPHPGLAFPAKQYVADSSRPNPYPRSNIMPVLSQEWRSDEMCTWSQTRWKMRDPIANAEPPFDVSSLAGLAGFKCATNIFTAARE